MKQTKAQKIVIIGCGNLSWHLAGKLYPLKKFELFIYNHRASSQLTEFRKKFKCKTFDSLDAVIHDASFYFICVPDRAISETSGKIKSNGIVMHVSGSKSINEISAVRKGVLYPVQTFSKNDTVDWTKIPLLIEASSKTTEASIKKLAAQLSPQIISANSEERCKVHLAAVLVNNFTNALFTAADEFLSGSSGKLRFNLLLPLIRQTVNKLDSLSPLQAQTGPAKRGDKEVMNAHLALLKDHKRLKKTYKQLSKLIEQQHRTHA